MFKAIKTPDDSSPLSADVMVSQREKLMVGTVQRHECEDALVLCIRQVRLGHHHHVYQCGVCGEQRGGPLAKREALELLGGVVAPAFDDSSYEIYRQKRQAAHREVARLNDAILATLDPPGAAQDAAKTFASQERQRQANHAIDQVVALIRDAQPWNRRLSAIIQRVKSHVDVLRDPDAKAVQRFTSETELRNWLDVWLGNDFEVFSEVPGIHLTENVGVKIDYVLKPKRHLLDAGFMPGPVGLEVKYLKQEDSFSSKASRFVWQSISYTDCEFEMREGRIRLPRVLLFSNMSFEGERTLLKGVEPNAYENEQAKWTALLELANHANVGSLLISGTRERHFGWKIKFATGTYFRCDPDGYSLHNARLFSKVRIGNF